MPMPTPVLMNGRAPDKLHLDTLIFFSRFVSPLFFFFFYSTDNFLSTTNDNKFFFGMFVSPLSFFSILLMTSWVLQTPMPVMMNGEAPDKSHLDDNDNKNNEWQGSRRV
jgi:hypothetical protein